MYSVGTSLNRFTIIQGSEKRALTNYIQASTFSLLIDLMIHNN